MSFLLSRVHALNFGISMWFQVVDVNPLRSIIAATQRIPNGWKEAWIPDERVSVEDAVKA